jgi:hypothetical protein
MLAFSRMGSDSLGAPTAKTSAISRHDPGNNADHTVARDLSLTSYGGVTASLKRGAQGERSVFVGALQRSKAKSYIDVKGDVTLEFGALPVDQLLEVADDGCGMY